MRTSTTPRLFASDLDGRGNTLLLPDPLLLQEAGDIAYIHGRDKRPSIVLDELAQDVEFLVLHPGVHILLVSHQGEVGVGRVLQADQVALRRVLKVQLLVDNEGVVDLLTTGQAMEVQQELMEGGFMLKLEDREREGNLILCDVACVVLLVDLVSVDAAVHSVDIVLGIQQGDLILEQLLVLHVKEDSRKLTGLVDMLLLLLVIRLDDAHPPVFELGVEGCGSIYEVFLLIIAFEGAQQTTKHKGVNTTARFSYVLILKMQSSAFPIMTITAARYLAFLMYGCIESPTEAIQHLDRLFR